VEIYDAAGQATDDKGIRRIIDAIRMPGN